MPWKECNEMSQRIEFVMKADKELENFAELCREYGISRTLGYKLLKRYREHGYEGIEPYSRRASNYPRMTDQDMVCEIVKLRLKHDNWGGVTIREILLRTHDQESVPSSRTIDRILQRSSLVRKSRRKMHKYAPDGTIVVPKEVNDVWTVDFKGQWNTKDGKRCYPLTIRDEHSKFILNLSGHESPSFKPVQERFRECFKKHGMPRYIRSDNGGPFAAMHSIQGLSRLSAWWVSLGILPNRIKPASPYMNGAHERMHRDIKHDLQRNPESNMVSQQKAFDEWVEYFNTVRPHQSLKNKTPDQCYRESLRRYDQAEPPYQYPKEFLTRKVEIRGHVFWKSQKKFLSSALVKHKIGIKDEDENLFSFWLYEMQLGYADKEFNILK